jgi:hypothetical protein
MVTAMDTAQHMVTLYAQRVITMPEQGIVAIGESRAEGQRSGEETRNATTSRVDH